MIPQYDPSWGIIVEHVLYVSNILTKTANRYDCDYHIWVYLLLPVNNVASKPEEMKKPH
jgi:hypothetical protein